MIRTCVTVLWAAKTAHTDKHRHICHVFLFPDLRLMIGALCKFHHYLTNSTLVLVFPPTILVYCMHWCECIRVMTISHYRPSPDDVDIIVWGYMGVVCNLDRSELPLSLPLLISVKQQLHVIDSSLVWFVYNIIIEQLLCKILYFCSTFNSLRNWN